MKHLPYIFLISFLNTVASLNAQFNWMYNGSVNGDDVTIEALSKGNMVSGTMKDSKQTYQLTGQLNDNVFEGKAIESSLGITFKLVGIISENTLLLEAFLDNNGTFQNAFSATFYQMKMEAIIDNKNQNPSASNLVPNEVANKPIDPLILGLWREESHYNSGYGDQSFSGSTYSYMTFNADHTMSDNGSQASMSGSNYSGNAGGQSTAKVIPNLWYYTTDGKVMAFINNNGQKLTTALGSYYIENGKMLFTQVNTGKKILYIKM